MPLPIAAGFETSAQLAADLVARDAVRERWDDESACAGMTTGGLAHHLAGQIRNTVGLLAEPAPPERPIPLAEHYRRARWVRAGLDSEFNTSIRDISNEQAQGGHQALVVALDGDLQALPAALTAAGDRRPDAVLVPWQGWALTAHDFLVTRLMEIVVHSDDLAATVGVPTPEFPDDAAAEVLGLLTMVAVQRHGQTAVVRALSRPQRAPGSVAAFGNDEEQ